MRKEIIRRNILDRREALSNRRFIRRDLQPDYAFLRETDKIAAVVGPRRAGKSTFLLQAAEDLGLSRAEWIFVDFSEIPWANFNGADFEEWQRLYEVALEFSDDPVFFLDEIQELINFAGGLRFLTNRGCRIFVTGSNSQVFERHLSTTLRGKVLTYRIFPLSFPEYLRFKGVSFTPPLNTTESVRRSLALRDFLTWGGFPEVVLADSEELKRSLLESYLDVMLFRDVVERHRVQNTTVLQKVLTRALLSFTKDVSVHRWYNDFRSQGLKVSKDTLYDYLGLLEEALFVFSVENEAAPGGSRKVYLVDNGLYQRVKDRPDTGKLLENQVFIDLLRSDGRKPRFFRTASDGEIDFVTDSRLIQVCTELNDENREREEAPLRSDVVTRRFPGRSGGIVTLGGYPEAGELK